MKKFALILAMLLPLAFSCSKVELDFKKGEALSIVSGGQKVVPPLVIGINSEFNFGFDIIGGTSNKHTVTVKDESILEFTYLKPGMAHWDGYNTVTYAQVYLYPKKLGATIIQISDQESGETITIPIEVRDSYYVFPVKKSGCIDIAEHSNLWFSKDPENAKIYMMDDDLNVYGIWKYGFVQKSVPVTEAGMYLRMEKLAGFAGVPVEEGGESVKEFKVMFNQDGSLVSAEEAIITLFFNHGLVEVKADEEVYEYILVDTADQNVTVTLDLPHEGYENL